MKLKEKIKEPFDAVLNHQFSQLESAAAELEEHKGMIKNWEEPRGNIRHCVLPQFGRWAEALKKIRRPVSGFKTLKKERKRLRRNGGGKWKVLLLIVSWAVLVYFVFRFIIYFK